MHAPHVTKYIILDESHGNGPGMAIYMVPDTVKEGLVSVKLKSGISSYTIYRFLKMLRC